MKIGQVRIPILLGLLLLAAPQASQAQLFPNLPIQRQRTPCEAEAPVFQQYRHVFHGYHPTCWRRFKPGWGCPSPEAPNVAAEYKKLPLSRPDADEEGKTEEEGSGSDSRKEGEEPGEMPLPTLPRSDRSPFELDPATGPDPAPAPAPAPRGRGARPDETSRLAPQPQPQPRVNSPATGVVANPIEDGLPPLPDEVETTSNVVVRPTPLAQPTTAAVPYPMPTTRVTNPVATPDGVSRGPDLHIRGTFPSVPATSPHVHGVAAPRPVEPTKSRAPLFKSLFRGRSGQS